MKRQLIANNDLAFKTLVVVQSDYPLSGLFVSVGGLNQATPNR